MNTITKKKRLESTKKKKKNKGDITVTSKKSAPAIKGDAFHDPMLKVLLNHFGEIPLQRIFSRKKQKQKF